MKKLLFIFPFLFACFSLLAEDVTVIKFFRQKKSVGSLTDIIVEVKGSTLILKNSSEVSINVPNDFSQPIEIVAKMGKEVNRYTLRAIPGESYVFEIGFTKDGLISKVQGKELAIDEKLVKREQVADNAQVNVIPGAHGVEFVIEKTDPTENIRQEWLKRGGVIKNQTFTFNGVYFGLDLKDYNAKVTGYGGGFSYCDTWYKLKIPEFKPKLTTWTNISFGWGFDAMIYRYTFNGNFEVATIDMEALNLSYPVFVTLGITVGLGRFIDVANWRGVVLTFKYRPSITFNQVSSEVTTTITSPIYSSETNDYFDVNASVNAQAIGVDFEFSSFSASMSKLAPMPKAKFSLFVLPPVKNTPLFISLGIGISFYNR